MRPSETSTIDIPLADLRRFSAVWRRLAFGKPKASPVALRSGPEGLRIAAERGGVGAELHLPGRRPEATLIVPTDGFLETAVQGDGLASFGQEPGQIVARWSHHGIPSARTMPTTNPDTAPPPVQEPPRWRRHDRELLAALEAATAVSAKDPSRYALDHLRLDGKGGSVAASDGHQILVVRGFDLPWDDGPLVPRSPLYGLKSWTETADATGVLIGRDGDRVLLRIGPWTIRLAVNMEGRFPDPERVLPTGRPPTLVRFDAGDLAFLRRSLPHLPGAKDDAGPITVEANGSVAVRAKGEFGPPTELALASSHADGPTVTFATNRAFLARAMELGFDTVGVHGPRQAIVCQDGRRTYAWQPLNTNLLAADPDAVRIAPPNTTPTHPPTPAARRVAADPVPSDPRPLSERSRSAMLDNHNPMPTVAIPSSQTATESADPIDAAEALRLVLRDALGRTTELVAALKAQRKQSKLVRSTLESLRQLDVR